MYLEYLVRLIDAPPGTITPKNARGVLNAALFQFGGSVPPALFGHDADGRNLQTLYTLPGERIQYAAPPVVAISGGQNFVRLTGIGPVGCDLLRGQIGQMAEAISRYTKQLYSIQTYSGSVGIEPSRPHLYHVGSMILQKNTKHLATLLPTDAAGRWQANFDDLVPHIEKAVVRGLTGQALHLDALMPEAEQLFGRMPSDERLAVKVLGGTTYFHAMSDKHKGAALAIRNLTFTLDAKLSGPWSIGQLRAHGFGAIRHAAARRQEDV